MIQYWESYDEQGDVVWHLRNTVFGDLDLDPASIVKGRVDLFGIAYVGAYGASIDVKYPDGQTHVFEGYTNNPEIITALRKFYAREPGQPLVDSRLP